MYIIRDREAGNIIEKVGTLEEAKTTVACYEHADQFEGIYEPDFYEIVKVLDDDELRRYAEHIVNLERQIQLLEDELNEARVFIYNNSEDMRAYDAIEVARANCMKGEQRC